MPRSLLILGCVGAMGLYTLSLRSLYFKLGHASIESARELRKLLRFYYFLAALLLLTGLAAAFCSVPEQAGQTTLRTLLEAAPFILFILFLLAGSYFQARVNRATGVKHEQNIELRIEVEDRRQQNIVLTRKSIELSEIRRQLEDEQYELEQVQAEMRQQNINLVKKSIALADTMRQLEDRNYELEVTHAELATTLASLQESEQKYRSIFESFSDVYYRRDMHGKITEISPSVKARIGYEPAEVLGQSVSDLFSFPEADSSSVRKLMNAGEVQDIEIGITTKDGRQLEFSLNAHVIYDQHGEPGGVEGVLRDITSRKRAEAELASHRKHLEDLVAARTAELASTNVELELEIRERRNAELAAAKANRLKSQFLANVSHEMRTPLSAIIGFAEIILQSSSLELSHRQSRIILDESNQLLHLINDLLDHAKIEAGKLELSQAPLDLHRLVTQVVSTVSSRKSPSRLEVIADIGEAVPRFVLGDWMRLRQILMNLAGNAVKFTECGSVRVRVEHELAESDSARLRFSVIDTGIGIPQEKQKAIFRSFSQVDGSTTRKYGGTGLGTTIARQLVELMGGRIGLESEPGKGSRFWFVLSLKTCPAPVIQEPIALPTELIPRACGTMHILLAEDYPPNQEVIRIHLESAGHTVEIVDNGAAAVDACQDQQYDLILMDVQMPQKDGIEATRSIRALSSMPMTPIIGLTAHAGADDLENCLQAGMNHVLTKPIRRHTLLAAVNRWQVDEEHQEIEPSAAAPADSNLTEIPFDLDAMLAELDGDRALVYTLIQGFFDQVEDQISSLREALRTGDTETLQRETHKLKGGASTLTALSLAASAERLGQLAKTGRLDGAGEMLSELVSELARTRQAVDQARLTAE